MYANLEKVEGLTRRSRKRYIDANFWNVTHYLCCGNPSKHRGAQPKSKGSKFAKSESYVRAQPKPLQMGPPHQCSTAS